MTLTAPPANHCALCGAPGGHSVAVEAPRAGAADLDTRGSLRPLQHGLVYCEQCGYCAPNLDQGGALERRWVADPFYQAQLRCADTPPLVNRWLCMDLIAQARQQWDEAAWACIQAAWACDDSGDADAARRCRLWALNRIGQARLAGQALMKQPGSELLLQLDLLRRAGRYAPAERLLQREGGALSEPLLQRILNYQRHLLAQRNDRRHSLEDMARWEAEFKSSAAHTPAQKESPAS